MIDKIISFGDSCMYGSDLSDCDGTEKSQFSQLTWPALCAKELGLESDCQARGGSGNHNISKNILNFTNCSSLVIINWSWIDRFDYDDDSYGWQKTIRPGSDDHISKFFYKEIHTEEDDKFRSLSYIYTAHQYLRNQNIPFISTYMDQLILDQRWNVSSGIIKLQDQIKDDLITFPNNQTFLEWSRSNGYPESKGCHPLEQAHQEAAKIWLPIYKEAINTHITNSED